MAAPSVPYAFATTHGVAMTAFAHGVAEIAVREDAQPGALAGTLAELRRTLGVPLHTRQMAVREFNELVSVLYNGAESGAAVSCNPFIARLIANATRRR